ncbi:hypothetical protein EI94DRAFT_1782530 [Lactarius quietus]|nr:hypothetical protein EI94DRAFT_1782530 [Lactarius quietus]
MLASPSPPVDTSAESLALYSQSLRDYTLRLWVESRRQADERVHSDGRSRKKSHGSAKMPMPTSTRKPSDDGNSSTGTPIQVRANVSILHDVLPNIKVGGGNVLAAVAERYEGDVLLGTPHRGENAITATSMRIEVVDAVPV